MTMVFTALHFYIRLVLLHYLLVKIINSCSNNKFQTRDNMLNHVRLPFRMELSRERMLENLRSVVQASSTGTDGSTDIERPGDGPKRTTKGVDTF
mmetsp:Transcript_28509/g.69096  ORF Transcript_28509/g.69096 Transcript_28509/m.69096 type:complete len:95 (+) Transcript_28509:236-520(+)